MTNVTGKLEPMRVLVADDELVARKRLVRLLAAIDQVIVVGECDSGAAVLERVREDDVDVILLDVQMPALSGLETIALLPDEGPLVVLCTAHADHAVDAFEHGAVDYILKPVEPARLKKALARVAARLSERSPEPGPAHVPASADAPALERLAIRTQQGIVLIDPKTVSHAVLEGELVTVVADGGTYLSDNTLNDLQERLPRDTFERVHRRALLNLSHVVRLEPLETGGFLAHTRGRCAVEVSRQAARELRKRLRLR
jgi:two-component system LytT family response regulator